MDAAEIRSGLRHWKVAGGVVRTGDGHLLLVENRRRNGDVDWSTPGGVVDEGESFVGALTREVSEETGLAVAQWRGPVYRVEVTAPDLGFFLEVEAHVAVRFSGAISIDDPDGIVLSAEYFAMDDVTDRLATASAFVRDPLLAHLRDGVGDGRTFAYRIDGSGLDRRVRLTSP